MSSSPAWLQVSKLLLQIHQLLKAKENLQAKDTALLPLLPSQAYHQHALLDKATSQVLDQSNLLDAAAPAPARAHVLGGCEPLLCPESVDGFKRAIFQDGILILL